jgi:hypothetical protein
MMESFVDRKQHISRLVDRNGGQSINVEQLRGTLSRMNAGVVLVTTAHCPDYH